LRVIGQSDNPVPIAGLRLRDMIRVDAGGGSEHRVLPGQPQACSAGRGTRTNGENRFDPSSTGSLQDRREVLGEPIVIQMSVGIDQHVSLTLAGPARTVDGQL
jgi:hypothetical protein